MSQTLAERLASASSQAAKARSPKAKANPKPTASAAPNPQPSPKAAKTQTPAAPEKKGKIAVRKRGNLSKRQTPSASQARYRPVPLTEAQRGGLIVALRGMSTRPGALIQLEPEVLEALEAVLAGSRVPGPYGHTDRMTLFRIVGLPLHPGAANGGGKAETVRALQNLTSAIERAHQRGAAPSGRVPVIVDAEVVEESPWNGASQGYPQKMGDLVRIADGQIEAPAQPIGEQIPAASEGDRPSSPTQDPRPWSLPDFLR